MLSANTSSLALFLVTKSVLSNVWGKAPILSPSWVQSKEQQKMSKLGQWKIQPRPHFCIFSVSCIPFYRVFPSQSHCEAMVCSPCYYHTNKPVEVLGRSRGSSISLPRGNWEKAKKKGQRKEKYTCQRSTHAMQISTTWLFREGRNWGFNIKPLDYRNKVENNGQQFR